MRVSLTVSTTHSDYVVNVSPGFGDSHGLDRPWKVEKGVCCAHGGGHGNFPAQLVSISHAGQLSSVFTSWVGKPLWAGVAASGGLVFSPSHPVGVNSSRCVTFPCRLTSRWLWLASSHWLTHCLDINSVSLLWMFLLLLVFGTFILEISLGAAL